MESVKNIGKSILIKCAITAIGLFYTWIMSIVVAFKWIIKGKSFWHVEERSLPPLVLQDPLLGRHSYVSLKDVKIHYVENGDRSKPMMLFLHGFPEFWYSWRSQLKYFAKDYWVVAIDMRGYGDSDKPKKTSAYTMAILEKDVVDFVQAVQKENCVLVGHDWGGAIAWSVASHYQHVVKKLVILNAPHPSAFKLKIEGSIKQFLKSWYLFAFQLPYFPEMYFNTDDLEILRDMFENKISEEELEAYKYNWAKPGAFTPPLNYYRKALDASNFLKPTPLPIITAPSLIIWGVNDLALEKDLAEMCKPYVENLKIQYISNANHFVQNDKPDEVNQLMEEFLGIKGNN